MVMTALLCPSYGGTHQIRGQSKYSATAKTSVMLQHSRIWWGSKVYFGGIFLIIDFGAIKQGVISEIWCAMRESYGGLHGETQHSALSLHLVLFNMDGLQLSGSSPGLDCFCDFITVGLVLFLWHLWHCVFEKTSLMRLCEKIILQCNADQCMSVGVKCSVQSPCSSSMMINASLHNIEQYLKCVIYNGLITIQRFVHAEFVFFGKGIILFSKKFALVSILHCK